MKMAVFITLTCILFSALLTPSASLHIQLHSSYKQAKNEQVVVQPSLPTFPRKLRMINEEVGVVGRENSDSKSNDKQEKSVVLGDKKHNVKEERVVAAVLHGSKEWQEWSTTEGTDDESNFFTMDYSRVRRRRPIHNKSVPVRRP